jgi:tetratricopeptide (TPR) repeat protein
MSINRSLLALLAGSILSSTTLAQPIEPVAPKDRAVKLEEPDQQSREQTIRAVLDRINAEFLTDEERADLRVLHGQWITDDLNNPALAAQIALDLNDFANPIFENPQAPLILRATAALEIGNPAQALILIEQDDTNTIESTFIRATSLELLGRTDEAIEQLEIIESTLAAQTLDDAGQLAIGCEALIKLTRLRSPEVSAKADYEAIEALLGMARDRVDRLDWRIRNAEAHLLYEHHNLGDAHNAAIEALRLNPRAAEPMLLLGQIAVDGFDFDNAEKLANTLDAVASSMEPPEADEQLSISIGGAIIRARIALRRRDAEGAEFALDPALAQYPNHPTLRALEASAAAAGYRMSSTNRLLERYDELFPNSPTAAVWVGKTLSESRQYSYAAEILRRAIDLAPNWGEPRLQLGLMLVQAGKDQAAREALDAAIKLDPFNLRAQNSLRLLTELATYETIESEHFIIRYKAGPDELLAREMPEILEAIHERVCSDLPGGMDHEPREKTIIELMPNHEWFAVRIGGMPSIHTMAASTGPVIAFESPREGPKSTAGHYDWERVLQHEYTHTVNLSRTRNRVIHWMTEANAVFNEDAPRDQSQWSLLTNAVQNNELFDLDSINIAFVRPKKPTDRALAYAQGAWMFEFIVERFGPTAPRDIMDSSATGRSAPEAFNQVLDISQSEFMDQFKAWAIEDLRSRGLLRPEQLPSLDELLGDPANGLPELSTIDDLIEQYPDHPDLLNLRLGIALAIEGERLSDEQLQLLKTTILVRPEDEMPHKRLARHYLASESPDEQALAIPHLEYLDVREVHTTAYANQLAELYAIIGDHQQALTKAIRATRIAPFDAPTREQAARMALLNRDYNTAEQQLKALIQIEPDRAIHQQRLDALNNLRDQ